MLLNGNNKKKRSPKASEASPLNQKISNETVPSDQEGRFFRQIKRSATAGPVNGKENSPKKLANKSSGKIAAALTFPEVTRVGSPKLMKQLKLTTIRTSLLKKTEEVVETDDDMTFCETFDNSKRPKLDLHLNTKSSKVDEPETISRPGIETDDDLTFCETIGNVKESSWKSASKLKAVKPTSTKKSTKVRDDSFRMDFVGRLKSKPKPEGEKLFNFQEPIVRKDRRSEPKIIETVVDEEDSVLNVAQIKKEKVSEQYINSDRDIFESDCDISETSSVCFVELSQNLNEPIVIPDQTYDRDDALVEQLNRYCPSLKIDDDETLMTPPLPEPQRNRKKYIKECSECEEFYAKYAEHNGPTQADKHIRDCNCRGARVRKAFLVEKIPLPYFAPIVRSTENQTPDGFWDMPSINILAKPSQDPDRTQDDL